MTNTLDNLKKLTNELLTTLRIQERLIEELTMTQQELIAEDIRREKK